MSGHATPHADENDNDLQQSYQQMSLSKRRPTEIPDKFVFGTGQRGSSRGSNKLPIHNINSLSTQKPPSEHQISLLEHLSADMANLLNRTDISDCLLNVKNVYMAVHKCILVARSNVFAGAIANHCNKSSTVKADQLETIEEKDKLIITINKTDPEIMKYVVIFMYTGKCTLDDSNAYELLDAAGRYDIKDLKVHTGQYLGSRVNSNNVLILLKAAQRYDNKLVKHRCIEYFINHAQEIMDMHASWKPFAEEQPEIVAELLHWLVHRDTFYIEKPKWEAASRW